MRAIILILCVGILLGGCQLGNNKSISDSQGNNPFNDTPVSTPDSTKHEADIPEKPDIEADQTVTMCSLSAISLEGATETGISDSFAANIAALTYYQLYEDNQFSLFTAPKVCLYGDYVIFLTGIDDMSVIACMRTDGSDMHLLYKRDGKFSIGSIYFWDNRTIVFSESGGIVSKPVFFDLLSKEKVDYDLPMALNCISDMSSIKRVKGGIIAYDRTIYDFGGGTEHSYYLNDKGELISLAEYFEWESYWDGVYYYQKGNADMNLDVFKVDLSTGKEVFILETSTYVYGQRLIGKWLMEKIEDRIILTDLETKQSYKTDMVFNTTYSLVETVFINNGNIHIIAENVLYLIDPDKGSTEKGCLFTVDCRIMAVTALSDRLFFLDINTREVFVFNINGIFKSC